MERAHVRAWPALRTADIGGWLWRSSGGGSQRANSVSTIDFVGDDPAAAVAEVEARYSQAGVTARFQTFGETSPLGLADLLRTRGYQPAEPTITMFKGIERVELPPDIEMHDASWPEWLEVYMGQITENRRTVNARIIDRVPPPRAFIGCRRGGSIVATALGVTGFGCAVIECVTTRSDTRRQGAARAVVTAAEAWAEQHAVQWIGLQVVPTNTPATRLYRQLGFAAGATNQFWVAGGDCTGSPTPYTGTAGRC